MKKKCYITLIFLTILLLLSSCAQKPLENPESVISNAQVLAAEFSNAPIDILKNKFIRLLDYQLYYIKINVDKDTRAVNRQFCRKDIRSSDEEVLLDFTDDSMTFEAGAADTEANLYLFRYETQAGQTRCYAEKYDNKGKIIYQTDISEVLNEVSSFEVVSAVANDRGAVCFGTAGGKVICIDSKGDLTGFVSIPWNEGKAIRESGLIVSQEEENKSGEEDLGASVFYYHTTDEKLTLTQIDPENARVLEAHTMMLQDGKPIHVMNGLNDKILLCDNESLWSLHPATGRQDLEIFWNSNYIDIDGNYVDRVEALPDGKIVVFLYDYFRNVSEIAVLNWVEESELSQREIITIGVERNELYEWNRIIREYNRRNSNYYVELQLYDNPDDSEASRELYLDLIDGTAPDLLNLRCVPARELTRQGMLEDLTSYFEQSSLVTKEDFLDSIWDAGLYEGKKTGAVLFYTLSSIAVNTKEYGNSGWTLNQMMNYVMENKDSYVLPYGDSVTLSGYLTDAILSEFADWESGTCSFDSEEFITLLEEISQLPFPDRGAWESDGWDSFYSGKALLLPVNIWSIQEYQELSAMLGRSGAMIGYPSWDGQPQHGLLSTYYCGIYSGSKHKDGAWSFLEYLLSEEGQEMGGSSLGFPVRTDSLRKHVEQYAQEYGLEDSLNVMELLHVTGYGKLAVRSKVEDLYTIVFSETAKFLYGKQSAQNTAAVLQRRAQLYMDENMER